MKLQRLVHDSRLLQGNLFGDPASREVFIVEPKDWQGEPLPALLGLAGFTGSAFGFLNRRWREENLQERFERLLDETLVRVTSDPAGRLTTLGVQGAPAPVGECLVKVLDEAQFPREVDGVALLTLRYVR